MEEQIHWVGGTECLRLGRSWFNAHWEDAVFLTVGGATGLTLALCVAGTRPSKWSGRLLDFSP